MNKIIKIMLLLLTLFILIYMVFNIKNIAIFINDNIILKNNSIEIDNTAWVISKEITWDAITGTIEIPNNIRDYLDEIVQSWKEWEDYIIVNLYNQPNLSSSLWKENNEIMHSYLYKNRNIFTIPKTDKVWYIMFVTEKIVSTDKNIFIWLDWQTVGWLNRLKSIEKWNVKSNEYLYKLSEIQLIWNNKYQFDKNIYKEMIDNKISINWVIWEANNSLKQIIIFFK